VEERKAQVFELVACARAALAIDARIAFDEWRQLFGDCFTVSHLEAFTEKDGGKLPFSF